MTGPQHFRAAEQLLDHTATMLDADVDPTRAAGLIQRQIAVATLGQAGFSRKPVQASRSGLGRPRHEVKFAP